MLSVSLPIAPFLKGNVIWFGHKPKVWSCLFTIYKQSSYCKAAIGYKRQPFYTKVIDLSCTEEELLKGFRKNTIYEVARAQREEVHTMIEHDSAVFVEFYNRFSITKGLTQVTLNKLKRYASSLVITKATMANEEVAMHAYVADHNSKRVRLLYSASLYRLEARSEERSAIGRANRFLHFKDMVNFKKRGFCEYDLGGYALNTSDPGLIGINHFKDGFSGELREESDFLPFSLSLFHKIVNHHKTDIKP